MVGFLEFTKENQAGNESLNIVVTRTGKECHQGKEQNKGRLNGGKGRLRKEGEFLTNAWPQLEASMLERFHMGWCPVIQ